MLIHADSFIHADSYFHNLSYSWFFLSFLHDSVRRVSRSLVIKKSEVATKVGLNPDNSFWWVSTIGKVVLLVEPSVPAEWCSVIRSVILGVLFPFTSATVFFNAPLCKSSLDIPWHSFPCRELLLLSFSSWNKSSQTCCALLYIPVAYSIRSFSIYI